MSGKKGRHETREGGRKTGRFLSRYLDEKGNIISKWDEKLREISRKARMKPHGENSETTRGKITLIARRSDRARDVDIAQNRPRMQRRGEGVQAREQSWAQRPACKHL